jgi:hypothetical protein
MADRGAKHQLCIFHLFKLIGTDVYAVLKSNRASYRDKIKLCRYFTEIKNVFRTYDLRGAQERLERVLDEYDDIPVVLRKLIYSEEATPRFRTAHAVHERRFGLQNDQSR